MDGFYEWQTTGKKKVPYCFTMTDGQLFAVAGLWERWHQRSDAIDSVAVLTSDANELVAPLHDRMPVIVPHESYDAWLRSNDPSRLLAPFPASAMTARQVSPLVNNTRNEGAQLPDAAGPIQRGLF
jgi:putative SOS response-associated peptidase YedK